MTQKKVIFLIIPLYFFVSYCSGQRLYRKFATQQNHQRLLENDITFRENRKKVERFTADFRRAGSINPLQIPVIFHVLYSNEEEQITEGELIAQLNSLNQDFANNAVRNGHPADSKQGFGKRSAEVNISFCLASFDRPSDSNTAINYIESGQKNWKINDEMKSGVTGGADPIDPEHYLNIWICKLDDELGGYSQYPGGPIATDGIVLDYRFVGPNLENPGPYSGGKTLTHLVGSYLNLLELWDERGKCLDDQVADTPIHNGPNYECPTYKHLSTCNGNPVEMTMNFMDYTDDACMYMFTEGQMWRMQAMLAKGGPRKGLMQGQTQCEDLLSDQLEDNQNLLGGNRLDENFVFKVYPNPVENGEAFLEINSTKSELSKITISDTFGKIIQAFDWQLDPGRQTYRLIAGDWPAGVYIIQIHLGTQRYGLKMVLNHH